MSGRNVQAIPLSGPIPLPLYEFGDPDVEEHTTTLVVNPPEHRPLYLGIGTMADTALLNKEDVEDLIAYCKVWLRALKIHETAVAKAAAEIRKIAESEL